tara:strand:+ start:1634 stop:1903 length:270 start_codon:yes stop_codon:yes gene_type:complete
MKDKIEVGYIDIPIDYINFTKKQKTIVCEHIIDKLLIYIDSELEPTINRIEFLDDIFDSTLDTNVQEENYEVAAVIRDCRKLINEERTR